MASQNQVGFSFQGDVIGGASLIHMATGRLLKALSDGGVDFYAVAAAVQLGKTIPISSARELEITSLIAGRSGRAGFLSKLLSIGWGYSDVAIELAKTRAGASALVTLGALATGASAYAAAQGFTELLSLGGCDPDMLPTVDVVKPMIAYLAPFVSDAGFGRVLESITTTVTKKCSAIGKHAPAGLVASGDAPEWAGAVHQLVFTASQAEELFLIAEQRGAWLAAWAAYILGMAVKVKLADDLLWESAGSRGSVIIQLGALEKKLSMIGPFKLVPPPLTMTGEKPLLIDYSLREALQKELERDARTSFEIQCAIQQAIVRLTASLAEGACMKSATRDAGTIHRINGNFPHRGTNVLRVCSEFGIHPDHINVGYATMTLRYVAWTGSSIQEHGLQYLHPDGARALRSACGAHSDSSTVSRIAQCLCCRIGGLIHAFGVSGAALMMCSYDPDEIKIASHIISGRTTTAWSRALMLDGLTMSHGTVTSGQVLNHLSQLLHGAEALRDAELSSGSSLLAVSAGATTIYYKAILDADAFDLEGKTVAIASGRLSCKGVLRKTVTEPKAAYDAMAIPARTWHTDALVTTLAPRSLVEPSYMKGPMTIQMDVALTEQEMIFQCYVYSDRQPSETSMPIEILRCIHNLMLIWVAGPCNHSSDLYVKVNDSRGKMKVYSFFGRVRDRTYWNFHALSENRLEQLLQSLNVDVQFCVYQGESCLNCALRMLGTSGSGEVIMS